MVTELKIHFEVFEELWKDYFNFGGHMLWQFADFETHDGARRVSGNKKGIFTRDRSPKEAAYVFKKLSEDLEITESLNRIKEQNKILRNYDKLRFVASNSGRQFEKRYDNEVYKHLEDFINLNL